MIMSTVTSARDKQQVFRGKTKKASLFLISRLTVVGWAQTVSALVEAIETEELCPEKGTHRPPGPQAGPDRVLEGHGGT